MKIHTALGNSRDTFAGLMKGQTGIAPVKHGFEGIAGYIPGLDKAKGQSRFESLLELVMDDFLGLPPDTLLITSTTKAGIDVLEYMLESKTEEQGSLFKALPGSMTSHVCTRLNLSSPGISISAACASAAVALARGAMEITSGRARSVLVVCAEIVSRFILKGFGALQALDSRPCRPFDRDRAGLSPGEGAAAIHLVGEDRAGKADEHMFGEIMGWGVACDAVHVTAPARDGRGLILAMNKALDRAGLSPEDVGAVNAHGTGTVYNDAMEMKAIKAVFKDRRLPVHSVKGALGHTMGAAGGIEAVLGCMSLEAGLIPPTVGLEHPDEKAAGYVSAQAQPVCGRVIVSTNSGFGGINAALVLGPAQEAA